MTSGQYLGTQARRRAREPEFVLIKTIASYQKPQVDLDPLAAGRANYQTSSCHGPAGGVPAAGIGRGVPAGCIPRGTSPNLAGRGEIATKTQPGIQTNFQL
jgi:hypothetical protein